MPVDCRGKLFHPLDLPQQLSHLNYPVTSVFLSLSFLCLFALGSPSLKKSKKTADLFRTPLSPPPPRIYGHLWGSFF